MSKRDKFQYPALEPSVNGLTRWEEVMDVREYFSDLPDDAKEWMNRFVSEYVHADLKHGGEVLHDTKAKRKICYDKNNARNRDIYTREKSGGCLDYLEELVEVEHGDSTQLMDEVEIKVKRKSKD